MVQDLNAAEATKDNMVQFLDIFKSALNISLE